MKRSEYMFNNQVTTIGGQWYKPKATSELTDILFECPHCGNGVRRVKTRGRIDSDGRFLYHYKCDVCAYEEYSVLNEG